MYLVKSIVISIHTTNKLSQRVRMQYVINHFHIFFVISLHVFCVGLTELNFDLFSAKIRRFYYLLLSWFFYSLNKANYLLTSTYQNLSGEEQLGLVFPASSLNHKSENQTKPHPLTTPMTESHKTLFCALLVYVIRFISSLIIIGKIRIYHFSVMTLIKTFVEKISL